MLTVATTTAVLLYATVFFGEFFLDLYITVATCLLERTLRNVASQIAYD